MPSLTSYMYIKNIILRIAIILCLFSINSCTITALWGKNYYKDTVNQFLISEDGSQVIFLGKKYHYIFYDNSNIIKALLSWKNRQKLQLIISEFNVISSDIDVLINLKIIDNKKLEHDAQIHTSSEDISFLKNLEFTKNDNNIFEKNLLLKGTRYRPKPNVNYNTNSLSKTYILNIHDDGFIDNVWKKIAFTPIAVANDAILISGSVVLSAIGAPIFITLCTSNLIINGKCIASKDRSRKK